MKPKLEADFLGPVIPGNFREDFAHYSATEKRSWRRVLGQIVGDREPRRLIDDKRVRVGADAGIIVKRRQRDAIERHGARVGLRAARVFVEFHQHRRAAHFTESAMRARCRLVKRDKPLADEKAKIGGGDPRPRAEWRAMGLLALPAMAMRGSHQGAVNLEAHPAAQTASAQRGHTAASWSAPTCYGSAPDS